ncbi:hypothetical protein V6N12_013583 [Hibiscus sabdariffa]|uniref:Uncharacterized protein n=1 Tax=Hibiscus sabdariffa TaxID=183260 RepID=A0ABR2CBR0_9ROSI
MVKETLDEKKTEQKEVTPVKDKEEEGYGVECKEVFEKEASQQTAEKMEVEEEDKVEEEGKGMKRMRKK